MRIVASGFTDVYVTIPEETPIGFNGIKERYYISPANLLKEIFPRLIYEGEHFVEKENTLCGLFYQQAEHQYAQLIRCSYGSAYIGIVDIRPESKNYRRSKLFFVSAENGKSVLIPRGFAVGYVTTSENTVMTLKMERAYEAEKNLLLNPFEPAFRIKWPVERLVVSAIQRYAPGLVELERVLHNDLMDQLYLDSETLEEVEAEIEDELVDA